MSNYPYHGEDFCITHGREFMRSQMGNPIPFCQACEDERAVEPSAESGAAQSTVLTHEPVGWRVKYGNGDWVFYYSDPHKTNEDKSDWTAVEPLYAALAPGNGAVETAEEMRKTARELREGGGCNAIEQAIRWERKADAIAPLPATQGDGE
jgi:hypothetical protein